MDWKQQKSNCTKYRLDKLVYMLYECSGPYPESYQGLQGRQWLIDNKYVFEQLRDKIMQGVERELKDIRDNMKCNCNKENK